MFALPLLGAATGASASTMATVGMVGSAVVGAGQAYQQYQAGKAANEAAKRNAQVMENEKQQALGQAKINMHRDRYNMEKAFSSQRAAAGASGVVMGGSQLDSLEEFATNNELGLIDASYNATQYARQNESEQAMTLYQGRVAKRNARYGAFGTLMSAGNSTASRYASNERRGIFKTNIFTPEA